MPSTPRPTRRQAANRAKKRRIVARQLAADLFDPPPFRGHDWPSAALTMDIDYPPIRDMLAQAKQVLADAARTPGRSWIGYNLVNGDSVVLVHGPEWSLVFAAHGRDGTRGSIYVICDCADDMAYPFLVAPDSRRTVEFSHMIHQAFGPAARCWD